MSTRLQTYVLPTEVSVHIYRPTPGEIKLNEMLERGELPGLAKALASGSPKGKSLDHRGLRELEAYGYFYDGTHFYKDPEYKERHPILPTTFAFPNMQTETD